MLAGLDTGAALVREWHLQPQQGSRTALTLMAAAALQGLAVADFKKLAYRDDHHPPRKGGS